MKIIPAIDIRAGRCVRLLQGDPNRGTIYGRSPVDIAYKFRDEGAGLIHLVDLDGAIEGDSENERVIRRIVAQVPACFELGGGIRSMERIRYWLEAGVDQVILGTIAFQEPKLVIDALQEYGAESIIIGVDAIAGNVAIHGWKTVTGKKAIEFGQEMYGFGIRRIIYTAIETDGMLTGPAVKEIQAFANSVSCRVTASGGVGSLDHIGELTGLESSGVDSVIVGKALYENAFSLQEAFAAGMEEEK